VLAPFAIRTFVSCGIHPWCLPFTKPREAMLTFLLLFSLLRDFASLNVELPCPYLASSQNRELLYSPGPQHSCRPSPPWHVVRSGGSTSLLMMSSGPTTLACLLDSLARGTHSCVHVQSKHGIQQSDPLLGSTAQILSAFRGFHHGKSRSLVPGLPISRFPICRNGKSHDTCPPSFGRSRSISEHSPLVSEV
jgi:hypothetical protein